jgi:hypothetical protein
MSYSVSCPGLWHFIMLYYFCFNPCTQFQKNSSTFATCIYLARMRMWIKNIYTNYMQKYWICIIFPDNQYFHCLTDVKPSERKLREDGTSLLKSVIADVESLKFVFLYLSFFHNLNRFTTEYHSSVFVNVVRLVDRHGVKYFKYKYIYFWNEKKKFIVFPLLLFRYTDYITASARFVTSVYEFCWLHLLED